MICGRERRFNHGSVEFDYFSPKKEEFMDNIWSKMTLNSLYEVSSYTYEHTYNKEKQK